jgi:hypothetical protein
MSRLKKIIEESILNKKLLVADEEAPPEDAPTDDVATAEEAPVEGAEEANEDAGAEEETEDTGEEEPEEEPTDETGEEAPEEEPVEDENFDDLDKAIEEMVGITEIQHTTSSTILDFEDGGQIMYVQPMVSLQSDTLNKMIDLIIDDVQKTYAGQKDEITGKALNKTKYWNSIRTLVSTMVKSQLTKSDNIDGLIDEIKQVFKVLEVK